MVKSILSGYALIAALITYLCLTIGARQLKAADPVFERGTFQISCAGVSRYTTRTELECRIIDTRTGKLVETVR